MDVAAATWLDTEVPKAAMPRTGHFLKKLAMPAVPLASFAKAAARDCFLVSSAFSALDSIATCVGSRFVDTLTSTLDETGGKDRRRHRRIRRRPRHQHRVRESAGCNKGGQAGGPERRVGECQAGVQAARLLATRHLSKQSVQAHGKVRSSVSLRRKARHCAVHCMGDRMTATLTCRPHLGLLESILVLIVCRPSHLSLMGRCCSGRHRHAQRLKQELGPSCTDVLTDDTSSICQSVSFSQRQRRRAVLHQACLTLPNFAPEPFLDAFGIEPARLSFPRLHTSQAHLCQASAHKPRTILWPDGIP
jgi:hypothetical protein